MVGTIASVVAAVSMAATMATAPVAESHLDGWESIGEQRITQYCPFAMTGLGMSPVPVSISNMETAPVVGSQ